MSLVGCSEPEMANVLAALGYRVHPPSDEFGRSTPTRSSRASSASVKNSASASAEQQRQQQRAISAAARAAGTAQRAAKFFAAFGQTAPGRRDPGRGNGPAARWPAAGRAAADGQRHDGPRHDGSRPRRANDGQRHDGPPGGPGDRGPREERRGPRPPRRDGNEPAIRLYATTEKKGEGSASDLPFAKLLELKLGGKSSPVDPGGATLAAMRLDKWLWHARFFKSRSLATRYVEKARCRLDGRVVDKAHAAGAPAWC